MNLIPYTKGQVKDLTQLPSHISFNQYKQLKVEVIKYYGDNYTKKRAKIIDRDSLLIDYLWETGGRIGDVLNIRYNNYQGRNLYLYNKKRKKTIIVTIEKSSTLLEDTLAFMRKYNIKDDDLFFPITIQNFWQRLRKYAKEMGFTSIHPHLFRHGLAIHLLNSGVAIPIISARLGHADIYITMSMYMKVTPEIQSKGLEGVEWR